MSNNFLHKFDISRDDYIRKSDHRSFTIWFTGLSGSGKSTLANALNNYFFINNYNACVLDGDNIRHSLNSDLDFSRGSRKENIRRISHVAKMINDIGFISICSTISPYAEDRLSAKACIGENNFFEIYCKCSLEECIERDVKGLYKNNYEKMTGVSTISPYEVPLNPDIIIETDTFSVEQSLNLIINQLINSNYLELEEYEIAK